ncbi:MAG: phage tail tape measure protein [Cyanobacteriota bacterium]
MDRVIQGLRGIEDAIQSSNHTLRTSSLGRQFENLAAGAREMSSRTSHATSPLKALRQEFRALRAESRNIDFGGVDDVRQFRAATREVSQYVKALESLERQVETDTALEREFAAVLKQQQRVAQQRVEMAEQQRRAVIASQRVAGAAALQSIGQATFSPLSGFERDSIQILSDFNDQMSQVQAVSRLTEQQLSTVRQKAKDLGAQTRFSASEAASGFIFLAQAGYTVDQQMAAIDSTLNLASAGALGLADATDIVVASLGGFQLGADAAAHVTDVLAKGAAAGATNVQQIGEALKYAGPPAKSFGSTIEETTAMIALLSNAGIKGSQAGTSLRAGFLRLAAPPREAKKAIAEMGLQIADASGKIRPMTEIIGDLQQSLSQFSDERKIQMVKALVGTEASASFLYLIDNADQLGKMGGEMIRASEGMGEAARQSKIMEQNLGGSFRSFASALEGVKITLIEPLEPILRFAIDTGTALLNFVTGLPAPFRALLSIGVGLTTALAGLAVTLGAVGVAAFGMQQAIATASVGMVALRSSALPLTGFFQTAISSVSSSPVEGLRRFGAELLRLPNPIVVTTAAVRGLGAAFGSAMLSPLGLAITGFGLLILLLSNAVPGVNLLSNSLMLLAAPFKILGGFVRGIGIGFSAALDGIFGKNLDPVVQEFSDFVKGLTTQLQEFEASSEAVGKAVGRAIAQIFVPIAKLQRAVAQRITQTWIGTITSIINLFAPLVRVAQAIGQTLVSLLAENSPGPTAQIRERWHYTVEWVQDLLSRLPASAHQVGNAIVGAFRWSAEATAELLRGYLERRVSRALIGVGGSFGKAIRHRFGEMLGAIFTAPMEDGIENQILSTLFLMVDRTEEAISVFYENISILPSSFRVVLDVLAHRFADLSNTISALEETSFRYIVTLGRFTGIAKTLSNVLVHYPGLFMGLAKSLQLFGGFATGIGLILTLSDRLRMLRGILVVVGNTLDRFGITASWLEPVISGIDRLTASIMTARDSITLLLRNLVFGQWSAAGDQLALGFEAAISQVSQLQGGFVSMVSLRPVLEQIKILRSSMVEVVRNLTQDPAGVTLMGASLGLSFVNSLGIGLIGGLDMVLRQFLQTVFSQLNALSGTGLGAALLGLFFVPSGVPEAIAGFVPLVVAGLTTSGLFDHLQSWISRGFDALLQSIDKRFGQQEWLHRLRDVFGQIDQLVRSLGTVLSTLVGNALFRVATVFSLLWPAVQSARQGLQELSRMGGISAVLDEVKTKIETLAPLLLRLRQIGIGLATPVMEFVQSIVQIASTFPVVQRLITMLGSVGSIAAQLPGIQQMVVGAGLAIAGGRRILSAAAPAAQAGKKMAISGMERVIQLMLWIGTGVYRMSESGVQVARRVPVILKLLSKFLNPLPALIGMSSGAMGRNGLPRITPIDLLGRMLPDILIPSADKAISGTKVRKILESQQAGFGGLDPFKQRELVTSYTEKLASPLGLINTPLFGPVAIASIELLGGALLGLVSIVGLTAAALYVFKPQAAAPIFSVFREIGAAVLGVAFILMHLGQTAEMTGKTLRILGLEMTAPGWAIATSRALNTVIRGIGTLAIALTNAVDFVLGIVPTLIRSTVLLVPLAIVTVAALLLRSFQDVTARIMSDTMVLGYAIVQAFRQGNWSVLGDVMRHALLNAFNATLVPVGKFVKFVFWDMLLSPISTAVKIAIGLIVGALGAIVHAVTHPIASLKVLVAGVLGVAAAFQAIRFAAILVGISQVANTIAVVVNSVEVGAAAMGVSAAIAATVALSPLVGIGAAIMGAIALVAALVVEYRRGFWEIQRVLVAVQHPVDWLNSAISNLIRLITTPVKPFDWLFGPLSDFLSGLGQKILGFFPALIGLVFGLNIIRKGLVKGMVGGFMTIVKAVTSITNALLGTIGAMVALGKKSRQFSQSFEGQVFQESVQRKGAALLNRVGIQRSSDEPLAVQQERDRQFSEKSAIVKFQKEIKKITRAAIFEYDKKIRKAQAAGLTKLVDRNLFGLKIKTTVLSKAGREMARKAVAQDIQQGKKQFSDENLKMIAKRVGLDISQIPGVGSLRELAIAQAPKLAEIQDLYSQSIDNIRKAEMRVESAEVEIVAKSIKNVANLDDARLQKEVGVGRKISTMQDILDLPFTSATLETLAAGSGSNVSHVMREISPRLDAIRDSRGGRITTLSEISLDTVKQVARQMGIYEVKTPKTEGYRFLSEYEPHLEKQGIPNLTKQLLMLQMMAKAGQITAPDQLAKAFSNPAESLRAIHSAMKDLEKANNADDKTYQAFASSAMMTLRQQFGFLDTQELKEMALEIGKASKPDQVMQILASVLTRQIEMVLEHNPVVQAVHVAEQAASTIDAATDQIVQQSQQVEKAARSHGIKGFFEAVLGRVQQIRRDINDSDFVTRIRENAQQAERDRLKAAQSANIKSKIASVSASLGTKGSLEFMQRIGALQDPFLKAIEAAEMAFSSSGMSKDDDELLSKTIRTLTTTASKDVQGKLDPKVLAALTTYARNLDPTMTVQDLLDAMRSKGAKLPEDLRERLMSDMPGGFGRAGISNLLIHAGVVTDSRSPVEKKYAELIKKNYQGTIQKIESGLVDDLDPSVRQALTQYARDYGTSLKELIDNLKNQGDAAIATVLREAGVIKELKDPAAIAKFLKSAGFKAAPMSLDSPEAKAVAQLMRGDVSSINTKVGQAALRMIAKAGNLDIAQLINPNITRQQLGEARKLRAQKLVQHTGMQLPELQQALELGSYDFEALLSGKTYAIQAHHIERIVKELGYQDREEFEQAMSAIALLQENRTGILRQIGNALMEEVGHLTGFTQAKRAQTYSGQLQKYRQQLTAATAATIDLSPEQIGASLAPQRQAGLQKALAASGQTQRQFIARLKEMGLADVFEQFMKTGQWVATASEEQIDLIHRGAFGKQIRPDQLAALRRSLEKNNLTGVLLEYLNNGRFLNDNTRQQEKLMKILQGAVGKIDERGLEDLQHFLRDNELTQYLAAYLKTGEFVTKVQARDKKAIAAALMGKSAEVEDLENLHQAIPVSRFERLKISFQLFALGLREQAGNLGQAIAEALEKTPLRPVSQGILKSFQMFQNRFGATVAQVRTRLSESSVGRNFAAVRQEYQRAKGRSLQGMTEKAGFSSLEDFVTAFRSQLQQKGVAETDINRELLAVLQPKAGGLRAGLDKGGMEIRQKTLSVMADLLGLAGADRDRLATPGGYTTDAIEPIQTYFVKRLPKIMKDATASIMMATAKAAGRAGTYSVKLAIQRFSPDMIRNAAQFARRVGFGAANSVNRIREYFAGSWFSKLLLPLENALDLRTRQVGRFLDEQSEAVASLPPPLPILERVRALFQTLAERVNGAITRIRSGIDAAQQTAKNLFTPIRAALSGLFGMLRNAVVRGVATARSVVGKVAQPVRDTIDRGMMGRYRQGGLMEAERFRRDVLGRRTEVQNFRESYGNNGIRLRSRTGRFLREDEAISLGPQRALMQQAGDRLKASPNAVPGQKTASRSFPVLPDPWEETKAEQFFKGIAQFLRALRRATPEVEAQTIEFFRSVNEGGDRTLRSVQTIPLGQRIKAALSKKLRDGLDVAARMADRGAGINPPRIKQAKPPEIAGLLPPASGMPTPQNSERAANGIARAFVQAATRAKAAWAQTGEEVSGKTWRTMVQRAYQTGLRILGFISEASPGPSRQIRQNYAHTAEEVSKDFHQMEQAAHDAGGEIAATMQHAAQKSSAGIGGIFQRFGAGAMRLGGAGMAIGGAIGAAGFAAQSIGFSLTNLELLDEESGRAIYRFTELLSIVTTIGGLVSPLIGAIASTLGAVLPILVTVGTAVGTFLISPIGIATAAVLGAIVLANEAAKRFLGIDILSSILSRAWEFAHQLVAPLTWPIDWIEQKWQGLVKRFGPTLEPIVAPAFEVGQKLVGSLSENSPGPTFLIRQNWGEAAQSVLSSIDQMSGTATMAGQEITDSLSTSGSNLSSFLNSVAGQQAKNLDNLSSIMSQNVSEFIEFLGVQSTGDATLDKIAIAKGAAGMDTTGIKSKSIDFALKQQGYSSEQIAQVNSIANMLQPSAKRLENSMNRLKVALTELRVALAATTLLQKPVDFRNALLSGKQAASGGTVAKAATEMGGGIRNAITGKVSTAVKPPKSYFGQLKSELKALLSSGESGLLAEIGTFVAAIAASPLAQIGGLLATVLILAEALTPSVNLLGEAFGVLAYGVGIAVGVIDGIIQGLGLQDEMNSIARVVKSTLQPILYLKDVLQRVVQRFQEARGAGQQFGQSIASAGIQAATQVQFAWIRFTTWFMTIPLVSIAMAMGQGLINALNHNPTVVIPLAWEEAVTKIIGWIEKLPLVGGWAGEQLKEGLKPGKWLSQGLHWVASAVDQLKQNIAKSIDILSSILSRAWEFAHQLVAPLTWPIDWIEQKWQGLVKRFGPTLEPIVAPAFEVGQKLVGSLSENSPGPTFLIRQNWGEAAQSVLSSIDQMSGTATMAGQEITDSLSTSGSNLSSFLNSVAGQQAKNLDNLSSIMSQNVSEFIEFLGVQSTGDATLDKIAIAKGAAGMDTTGIKSKSIDFALKQQGYSSEQIAQVNSIANMLQPSAKRLENSMNRLKVALTELRVALAATTLLQKPVDFRNALLSGKQAASGGTVAKAATEMGGGIRNAITGKVSTAVKPPKSYFGQLKSELKALLSSGESGLLAEIGTFVAAIAASPLAQIGGLLATVLILAEALTPSVNLLGEAFGVLAYGVGIAVGVIDGIIQGLGLQDEMNSIARVVKSTLQPILYLKDVLQRVVQRFQEARGAGQQFGQSIASAGIQAATQVQFAWIRFTTWFMTIPLVSIAMAMGQGLINALNHNPTVVIPLAWEEAVTKIIGWIEKLPLVGGWAGEQLKEGLKPGKWLSQGLHWVASAVDQLKQNIAKSAEFEFKVKVQKPEKKSIPLLPPPPKFNLAEQMSDRTTYFQRGGGLAEGLAPGLQQASYGVQFLTRSFREFGGEAFGALKRLDFAALSSSAQKFGDHARFALGIVTQGFRSMSLSAVAFGIASLVGLGPVNLVLLGIGALVLAIATNFLGLRDVLVGSIRVVIGLLRATVSLVNGAAQIMLGAIKTIVGVVALLGGNLEMMHDGIAMMRRGLEAIATGVAQGLRQSLGGAIQLIRGLLQGLQQTALLAFNSFRNVVMAVWSTFRGLGTTIKAIGSALVAVLTRPQEVWERFLGVANQVASVVQRIVKSPQIAVNTAENLALGKAPTVREAYQMAEFDDRLGAREALGNLAYSTANTLSLVSPTLGAPAMAVLGMVDSIWSANESLGHLKQSYEAIQPAVQQGIQQFMQLGFQNGFAASMTKLLAIAQVGLAKTMAIVGAAAKFMWKAITGPLAPVILGIGLVIAAIVALVMAFRRGGLLEVLRPFRDAWYILADAVGDVLRGIGIALNQLANALMLPFEPLLNLFGISGGGGLGGLIANTFRLVLSPLSLVAQGIGLVIRLIGGVVIGIIQVAAVVTRALLLPVAGAIAWIVQAVQGAGRGIAQGFGGAIANITRPIAHLFESLWITLRNVGDSLVEPFEPLLQLFGTSGAGGLGQLLGNAFRLLLSPLGLITTVIGTMVRLVGVVLVGALRLVGTVLKPIIHLLVAPVLLLGQLIRGIFSMARAIVSLMLQSIQMIWALMPPPLKWAIEVASKGVGLLTGGAAPTQPQRFAQGGLVTGPGGGDRIPALLQRDEFVVTAAATRQNYGFLDAINSGVPAEEALKILPTAAPAIVQLMPVPVSTGAVAATPTAPTVQVVLNFNGNIVLTGGSGTELADEMMQHLGPRMEMAVREALRNMVERMR